MEMALYGLRNEVKSHEIGVCGSSTDRKQCSDSDKALYKASSLPLLGDGDWCAVAHHWCATAHHRKVKIKVEPYYM